MMPNSRAAGKPTRSMDGRKSRAVAGGATNGRAGALLWRRRADSPAIEVATVRSLGVVGSDHLCFLGDGGNRRARFPNDGSKLLIGDLETLPQDLDLDLVPQIQRIAKIGLPAFVHGNLPRKENVARDVAALRRHRLVDDGTGCAGKCRRRLCNAGQTPTFLQR